jgi:hypothetical protein
MARVPGLPSGQVIGAILLILLALIVGLYLVRRWMASRGDDEDDSGQQRVEERERSRSRTTPSLSMRQRFAAKTWPAKMLIVGIFVILVVVVWNTYTYLKTGSPTQMAYARETQFFVIGLVTFGTGIWWDRRQHAREGVIDVQYEPVPGSGRDETVTERIHYNPTDVVETEHGDVAHQYKDSRFMGLYRQPMVVADDKRLRNDDQVRRPLSDKVGHQIPPHAIEVEEDHYVIRTKGRRTTATPESVADYEYRPPYSMSMERKLQIEADVEEMAGRVDQMDRKLGHKDEMIHELEKSLENARTEDWRDLIGVLHNIAPLIGRGYSNQQVLQKLPDQAFQSHSPRDGEEMNGQPGAAGDGLDGIAGSPGSGSGGGGQ